MIDLIEQREILCKKIELSDKLISRFNSLWEKHVGEDEHFKPSIANPFWHMQSEPFWRLISNNGDELTSKNMLGGRYSLNNLRKQMKYAEINEDLYDMLSSKDAICNFKDILFNLLNR